jgi:amino acid permease
MSGQAPNQRKSKISESPEVILEAAVPIDNGRPDLQPMTRLTTVPIAPGKLPNGMKTPSMLKEELEKQLQDEHQQKQLEEERNKKTYKLLALGAAIATGAIIAYKVSGMVNPVQITEQAIDEINKE